MNFIARKENIFIVFLISFVAGIGIASLLPAVIGEWVLYFFVLVMLFLVIVVIFWKNRMIRVGALVAFFLLLGVWRFAVSIPVNSADNIWHYNGHSVGLFGWVCEEPDVRTGNQKLTVCSTAIFNTQYSMFNKIEIRAKSTNEILKQVQDYEEEESEVDIQNSESKIHNLSVSGRVLVTVDRYPEYEYGDDVEFGCDLQAPEAFDDFAYDKYLARYDVYSVCHYPDVMMNDQYSMINSESSEAYFILKSRNWIIKLRKSLQGIINQGLSEPEAGLANAMFLGYKRGVGDELRSSFARTGLSHIMAISGLHIGIIGVGLFNILMFLCIRRPIAFWISAVIITVYIVMIGVPASAVRAGIMGGLMLYALNIGRLGSSWRVLIMAGAVLLAFNPKLLISDVGFQLSFLAVFGIILLYPRFKRFVDTKIRIRNRTLDLICDLFLVSLSAQIFTLPILVVNFGIISLIAPIANIMVLPLLPLLIVTLIGATIGCTIFPSLAWIIFTPAYIILKYIIFVTHVSALIPFSSIILD